MSDYIGIDYGRGLANVDEKTGIRYGLVSINSLESWIWDELTPVYVICCPHCGEELGNDGLPDTCPCCDEELEESDFWESEPTCWEYDGEDWKGYTVGDSCYLFVIWSQTIVNCQFCSPCYPGAGNLDVPMDDGIPTYGLPDEFFRKDEER